MKFWLTEGPFCRWQIFRFMSGLECFSWGAESWKFWIEGAFDANFLLVLCRLWLAIIHSCSLEILIRFCLFLIPNLDMCYLCGQILSHHECLSNYILTCTSEISVSRVSPDVLPYPIATIIFFTSWVTCNITEVVSAEVVSDYDGKLCWAIKTAARHREWWWLDEQPQ